MRFKTLTFFLSFLIILPVFFSTGCGLTGNLVDWKGDRELEEYAAGRRKLLIELQQYIDKDREGIREFFGEPKEIFYNRKLDGIEYEELWEYKYHRGIFLIYSEGSLCRFFFNQGKVVAVDVL